MVWCPKYRRPVLVGRVAERLRELLGAKCAEHGWTVEALEVMPDHVHLFDAKRLEALFRAAGARRVSIDHVLNQIVLVAVR